jgi:hypothetical protein
MFDYQPTHLWRSYKLPADLVARIDATAQAHNVYKSDLVAFLLTTALDQADGGELIIKTRPPDGIQQIVYE